MEENIHLVPMNCYWFDTKFGKYHKRFDGFKREFQSECTGREIRNTFIIDLTVTMNNHYVIPLPMHPDINDL